MRPPRLGSRVIEFIRLFFWLSPANWKENMNKESKFAKTIRYVSNICIVVIPIFTVLYFSWLQKPRLFISLENYQAILSGCDLILWIVFLLTLVVLAARKRIALGIILFLLTAPCLTISSLCLIGDSPDPSWLFSNVPPIVDHIQFENNTYYLTSEIGEWGISHLELYKCGGQVTHCEQLGEVGIHSDGHFISDVSKNELNVVNGENDLIYTYGEHSRSYEDYSKTKLGNHLYYVSDECNGNNNSCVTLIFSLYECNLNNISCNQLPFQYIGEDGYSNLQVDDSAKEINFYLEPYPYNDPGILIYTYGPHPRCYINGCTITSEQK